MKILLLDGNSILNRAFYGIRLLSAKNGQYTNAIYGFINVLNKLCDSTKPDAVAVAFDLRAPTFRHEIYSEYKANRKGMPDELASQVEPLKKILQLYGYKTVEKEGYEADDIIGTLAKASRENGGECIIASSDRDMLQLASENVSVYLTATKNGKPEVKIYDTAAIQNEYGTNPHGLIEIKALQGDASDNIPGVAGVGPKTAGELINKYKSIDYIYDNIDTIELKGTLRDKLIKDKENAFLSRKLGIIENNVPINTNLPEYKKAEPDFENLAQMLRSLDLYTFLENLKKSETKQITEPITEPTGDIDELIQLTESHELYVVANDKTLSIMADGKTFITNWNNKLKNAKFITNDCRPLYLLAGENINIVFELRLAAYLLNPDNGDYSLQRLKSENGIFDDDLSAAKKLYEIIGKKTKENNLEKLLFEIEIPLSKVIFSMEQAGVLIDENGLLSFSQRLTLDTEALQNIINAIIGEKININSPKQLGEALFEKMGLPHGKKTKTGYSTSAETLESLRHEYDIIEYILEYRKLSKLKTTYCDGLLSKIENDGRIRTTFNQTETRTGRISSSEPNLQNIPVRTELGREMRKFFISEAENVLVDADYSQIELRILAHIANDETMINAFKNDEDIHTLTASQVHGVELENVTGQMRTTAKAVNFGIIYGIGAFSLANDLKISVAKAREYIEKYLQTYHGVAVYMDEVISKARENGFVTTFTGRRRYLPELNASNFNIRSFGERVARNMPIQGAAADIIKIAMINVYNRLKNENKKAKLILQVHDELIIECPENEAEQVSAILKEEMENAVQLKVKLTAEVNTGKNWYDTKI